MRGRPREESPGERACDVARPKADALDESQRRPKRHRGHVKYANARKRAMAATGREPRQHAHKHARHENVRGWPRDEIPGAERVTWPGQRRMHWMRTNVGQRGAADTYSTRGHENVRRRPRDESPGSVRTSTRRHETRESAQGMRAQVKEGTQREWERKAGFKKWERNGGT